MNGHHIYYNHILYFLFPQLYKNITLNSSIDEIQAISKNVTKFVVNDLYLMMGRELEPISQVPCGNIVAIGGLENLILKSATLSSTLFCPAFTSMHLQASPIVRVAIEPKNPCILFYLKIQQLFILPEDPVFSTRCYLRL